jgi:hypothetical protein
MIDLDPFTAQLIKQVLIEDARLYGPTYLGGPGTSLDYLNQCYQKALNTDSTIPARQGHINEIFKQIFVFKPTDLELEHSTEARNQAGLV